MHGTTVKIEEKNQPPSSSPLLESQCISLCPTSDVSILRHNVGIRTPLFKLGDWGLSHSEELTVVISKWNIYCMKQSTERLIDSGN